MLKISHIHPPPHPPPKADLSKWRGAPCSWIERVVKVKMLILPKLIYRFNATLTKSPKGFFVDMDKLFLKLV